MPALGAARTAVQFILLALVWGSSFLFIKIGLEGLTPAQVVWSRVVLGSAALLTISAVVKSRLPSDLRVWAHLAVVAALLNVIPFLLFSWSEQLISSGLASILNATTPLQTLLVAIVALPEERPTRDRVAGLGLGFAGVLVVLAVWRTTGPAGSLTAQFACLAATACYGLGFVYLRRFLSGRGLQALPLATVQVSSAAVVMLAGTPLMVHAAPHLTVRVVASMIVLGIAGTGLAYIWNTNVITAWGATSASTVTYLTPLVGVLAGSAVLREAPTWNQPLGAALVILGVLVGNGLLRHRTS